MDEVVRERVRKALLSGAGAQDELRKRFEDQVELVLRPRLSRGARIARAIMAAICLAAVPFLAYGSYVMAVKQGEFAFFRLLGSLSCGCLAISYLLAAVKVADQARSGRASHRRMHKANTYIPLVLLFVYVGVILMRLPGARLPAESMVGLSSMFLFVLTMSWGFVLHAHLRWHRQDHLIERTWMELEIATLREELARKT